MEQVEKFDPSTLMQGVKDRIKATFVSLIPDAQWDEMMQKEIDAFFTLKSPLSVSEKKQYKEGDWNPKLFFVVETEQTPFRAIVWNHLAEMTSIYLKEKINKEYFTNTWINNQPQVTDGMKQIINEAAPLAAVRFFEAISFGMVNELQNRIQQIR